MAVRVNRPVPGHENTISISETPVTRKAMVMPNIVTVGRIAFLNIYLRNIFFSLIPVARSVKMNSSLVT